MKKWGVIALVILIFFIFLPPGTVLVHAQDAMSDDPSPSLSPVITMENKEIQYDLPYPGLLPDNPLYFLKVVRDNIEGFLITDPAKKADFDMQQADKRMNMSISLFNEHPIKEDLISSTVSKALNYFQQGVTQAQQAQKQREVTKSFITHMDVASQKYRQVIMQLETKASSNLKNSLDGDQERLAGIRNTVLGMEKGK